MWGNFEGELERSMFIRGCAYLKFYTVEVSHKIILGRLYGFKNVKKISTLLNT